MSKSSTGVALMSAGAAATVAGALMYVLPGPGLPVLVLGLVLMGIGATVRILGRR
ncbi:hypothetical protein [Streptomyces sp. D2-8]|uniref:hypothetical protein n=1 Tax=Streptomyces sp. D2-8 TaxID=2707767 RepID=UPI0020BE037F|nr:hypothetical protein [Streptomyces sp. D2-8]